MMAAGVYIGGQGDVGGGWRAEGGLLRLIDLVNEIFVEIEAGFLFVRLIRGT